MATTTSTVTSAVTITDKLLSMGAAHGRTGQLLSAEGIVIHYVGNPGSSAIANRNYFENGSDGNGVSAHYIVGLDGEIIRCIPEDERAQHAGKSYAPHYNATAPYNNSRYIGIENCHPDASGKFNDKAYNALVALVADICHRRRWENEVDKRVLRHYDVAGKACPLFYVNNPATWEKLKADIKAKVAALVAIESTAKTPVMGASIATAAQMDAYAKIINPNAPAYGAIYIEEGDAEGVCGDIAYCQALAETSYFRFGGDVLPEQNNFAGLGATGGVDKDGSKIRGLSFATAREGIRAQIQHLKAYASKEPLVGACIDPRFGLVTRGVVPNWEDLDGRWAVPGKSYGANIVAIWNAVKCVDVAETPAPPEMTVKEAIAVMASHGIIQSPEYWEHAVTVLKYLDTLLIKTAQRLNEITAK